MGNSPKTLATADSFTNELKDVLYASTVVPHSYATRDERMEVTDNMRPPYNWVCSILVETQQGGKYLANGFKIRLSPSLPHQVILTSGHSVFINGSYAKRITVKFPGQNSVIVSPDMLWAPNEFTQDKNVLYNFGIITIPGTTEEGFHWTTLLSDNELLGRPLSCCGYPSDMNSSSLWISGGGVDNMTEDTLQYMYDSRSTSSGSAVYTWHKGYWTAIGIQSHEGIFNTAVRLNTKIIRSILSMIGFPLKYAFQSHEFINTYLCTDMNTLDIGSEEEIVTIACRTMTKTEPDGLFDVIPLTSINPDHQVVAISPSLCPNIYLMLTKKKTPGLSVVDEVSVCNDPVELCLQRHSDGTVAVESANERGVYLSIASNDGSSVTDDGGVVDYEQQQPSNSENNGKFATCHLVPKKQEIRSTERFILLLSQANKI